MNDTIKMHALNVDIIAHRGLSGLERENTNAAFIAAGNRSFFGIETDIHKTLDGHFVVYHDDNTLRLTDVDWNIEEHTLTELRTLTLKDLDGNIRADLVLPTLQEYVRICKKYNKVSVLELKNHFEEYDVHSVIEIIKEEGWLEHTIFISFDLANLICIRKALPKQPLQYLAKMLTEETFEIMLKYQLDADVDHENLDKQWVKRIHDAGRLINVWTVDKLEDGLRMLKIGVDQITSNILE